MKRSTLARLAVAAVATALVATALSAPTNAATPSADPAISPLPEASTLSGQQAAGAQAQAKQALKRAEALAHLSRAKAAVPSRDATLALRDLSVLRSSLSASDRAKADQLLARPTMSTGGSPYLTYTVAEAAPICGANVCVHYVTSTSDASTTDYANQVLTVMEKVYTTYAKAGYKSPPSDASAAANGGNGKFDVYLGQLADDSLYGYVTTDDPDGKSRWSYGVFDNNYTDSIFNAHTPLENLQVTAAHEFFHAVQYSYDVYEDAWFMEATATWAEDELYPSVNDNLQYLSAGQLGNPYNPLDAFYGAIHYGNWIYFRYLSEKWPRSKAGLPVIVRSMWQKAGKKDYSIKAINSVLKSKKTSFAKEFSLFSAKNRFSRKFYKEGKKQKYPQAPIIKPILPLKKGQGTNWLKDALTWHQSSAAWAVKPKKMPKGWKLAVQVDLAPPARGQTAVVDTISKKGKHKFAFVKLNKKGKGTLKVPFASKSTKMVVITLANASTRYACHKGTIFACGGNSKDDKVPFKFRLVTQH